MTIDQLITNNYFIFFVGFLGMMVHFLKKYKFQRNNLKLECDGSVWKGMYKYFFSVDVVNTLMTVILYTVGYFVAYQLGDTSVYAMFMTGYAADSLLNKAEEKKITPKPIKKVN